MEGEDEERTGAGPEEEPRPSRGSRNTYAHTAARVVLIPAWLDGGGMTLTAPVDDRKEPTVVMD
jgi:hypothetical protein